MKFNLMIFNVQLSLMWTYKISYFIYCLLLTNRICSQLRPAWEAVIYCTYICYISLISVQLYITYNKLYQAKLCYLTLSMPVYYVLQPDYQYTIKVSLDLLIVLEYLNLGYIFYRLEFRLLFPLNNNVRKDISKMSNFACVILSLYVTLRLTWIKLNPCLTMPAHKYFPNKSSRCDCVEVWPRHRP